MNLNFSCIVTVSPDIVQRNCIMMRTPCVEDGNRYSVPVIGTSNKIQGRNTLEKGLQIASF